MARRGASRKKAAPRSERQPWFWVLTGLGLGFLIAGIGYLLDAQTPVPESATESAAEGASTETVEDAVETSNTRFDFYRMLPEVEVAAPADAYTSTPRPRLEDAGGGDKTKTDAAPQAKEQAQASGTQQDTPQQDGTQQDTQAESPASNPSGATAGGFLLQAGAFGTHEDADRLKARLALLGLVAKIQPVQVEERVLHRVRLGPYQERARAEQVQARLGANSIEAMVVSASR